MAMFIVTVKLPRNPRHDPRNKQVGTCPVSGGVCTDVTGEHHSYVMMASNRDEVYSVAGAGGTHVTRVESV